MDDAGVDIGLITHKAAARIFFGVIECKISIASYDQRLCVLRSENCAADCHAGQDCLAVKFDGRGECTENQFCSLVKVIKRVMALDDDCKLVTASTEGDVWCH